ncbi:DDE-type integrase/transposase/recombinase, partial [Escherichia coli]
QNDVTLKMPAFEWVHVQLHQQKGMISLSPPTICNSASDLCPWHMDETYVKVNGRWAYLYRAVDSRGRTVDFYL